LLTVHIYRERDETKRERKEERSLVVFYCSVVKIEIHHIIIDHFIDFYEEHYY